MFIQTYHQDGTLITEQQVNEYNPLFELVNRKQLIAQSLTSWSPHNTRHETF